MNKNVCTEVVAHNLCIGCGVCYFGCPTGGKWSVDKAQIPAAVALGLNVLTRAKVEKIVVKNGRATGVEGVLMSANGKYRQQPLAVTADVVVVCAGGIDTPILLQKSGLGGPGDGIGGKLHVHPGAGIIAYFPELETEIWRGVPQGAFSNEFADEGFLYESSNLPASAFYMLGAKAGEDPTTWMARYRHIVLAGGMLRDEGKGRVKPGPLDKADLRIAFSDNDLTRMKASLLRLGRAYFDYGAAGVIPNIQGAGLLESYGELEAIVARIDNAGDLNLYGSHPQSTVAFDADAKRAPLHPNFHLHKVPNIFVADASVFPVALGVNPQITIMALGRIAGDYVAGAL